ncbi:MAG: hypothetical protein ACI970_000894 [Myxococcota bacterium]|jgi:hypothetical protein
MTRRPRRLWSVEMGFDSTRRYRDGKWSDIGLLVAGIVIVVPALLWGFGVFG